MADNDTATPSDAPAPPQPPIEPSQIPPTPDPALESDTQKGVTPSSIPNTVDQSLESHIQADNNHRPPFPKNP